MSSTNSTDLEDSVLPMVIVRPNIEEFSHVKVNAMCDSGSQISFINEELARDLKLKICRSSLDVSVKGFNEVKSYCSKTVYFPITFNGYQYEFECLCIPKIGVQFSVPHLGKLIAVLSKYNVELHYEPYYEHNLKKVENIDVVLGNKDCIIISDMECKCIGPQHPSQDRSVCHYTRDGKLVPNGSLESLINNLHYVNEATQCTLSSNMTSVKITPNQGMELNTSPCSLDIPIDDNIDEVEDVLDLATYAQLDEKCNLVFNLEKADVLSDELLSEEEVTKFVLENSKLDETGRHEIAIPWLTRFKHRLQSNERLAFSVLKSVQKKYSNQLEVLIATDDLFRKQLSSEIIVPIHDINLYKNENPGYSFLSHFPLLKPDRTTTKTRVIYMCNLAEKNADKSPGISLNNITHPGFTKNSKINAAFYFTRFEKYILTFDIQAAFHCIAISEANRKRFIFMWFKDVKNGDFTPIYYQFTRVAFGLAPAPFLLTVALHRFLMDNPGNESTILQKDEQFQNLKKLIYHSSYVDNFFVPCSDVSDLQYTYDESKRLFELNKFPLQQWATNHVDFQSEIDSLHGEETEETSKILGMIWKRNTDRITAPTYKMKEKITSKRQVLRELHSNYDLMGINIPLLNRAKLFLRNLQLDEKLGWDTFIGQQRLNEWRNIVRQYNSYDTISVPRSMGNMKDNYELISMVDASKNFLGSVIYVKNVDSGQISFLQANNRLLDRITRSKTTPTLEISSIEFGAKKVLDVYQELKSAVFPVNITKIRQFSDSTIALSWLNDSEKLLKKIQTRSTFVNNKINNIVSMCSEISPISFYHVGAEMNSADMVTRTFSPSRLRATPFIAGPKMLQLNLDLLDCTVVPNPMANNDPDLNRFSVNFADVNEKSLINLSEIFDLKKYSSLKRAVRTLQFVKKFCSLLKSKLFHKDKLKYAHFGENDLKSDFHSDADRMLILQDQLEYFPELFSFFRLKLNARCAIPPLISQMNIILDPLDGLLKVKSKMGKLLSSRISKFPLLLHSKSYYLRLVVNDSHKHFNHSGVYYILNQLRRKFFILKAFSSVKNIIRECVHCKRFNARSIKVNSNDYKEFMVNPKQRLYSTLWIDYAGPFQCHMTKKEKQKVYLLIFKCAWSRHINIEITTSADTKCFLMAFQSHVYEYGLPSVVNSDAGCNLNAGFNWLKDVLDTIEVKEYFEEMKIQPPEFHQIPRGGLNRGLPGFIESGVKMVKRLIQGSIRNNVLTIMQLYNIVKQCICYSNKRPLNSFCALRDQDVNISYRVLTPEVLKLGYETAVIEINLPKQELDNWTPEQLKDPKIAFENIEKLIKIKDNIRNFYHDEFLYSLMDQASRLKGKYLPVSHQVLNVGDICIIKDPFVKPSHMPYGIIVSTTKNTLGEVIKADIRKANKSIITRDISDIVLIIRHEAHNDDSGSADTGDKNSNFNDYSANVKTSTRMQRIAASNCNKLLQDYYSN